MFTGRIKRLVETDEVARNELGPLMKQLIERVLAIGARFAPKDRPSLIVNWIALQRYVLAVALHGQLLEIGWEALQVLFVWQDCDRLRVEKVVVPDR